MFCRWAQSDIGIFTHLHVLPFLVTFKFEKDPIKNERASVETIRILHGREVQTEIDKHMF